MRFIFLLAIHLALYSTAISQRLQRWVIDSLPGGTDSTVFIAGSFNGWNPADSNYHFKKEKSGRLSLQVNLPAGKQEFKLTLGSWDRAEVNSDGSPRANRVLEGGADSIQILVVQGWAKPGPIGARKSTATGRVIVLDTAFYIPQLKRTRRVLVYLPDRTHHYPVLYMQDAQNVFDEATSFSGEWGIDEFLDSTRSPRCIVVAIDHGNEKRLTEYNPYDNARFGKGEGKQYMAFLVKTLKPFIDKRYNTLKNRDNTFITGSSMGGLISLYAVLRYPQVFGGAAIFSPSIWVADSLLIRDIKRLARGVHDRIYWYAGMQEGESMATDIMKSFEQFSRQSRSRMQLVLRADGKHNEATWRREFPAAYRWLLGSSSGKKPNRKE